MDETELGLETDALIAELIEYSEAEENEFARRISSALADYLIGNLRQGMNEYNRSVAVLELFGFESKKKSNKPKKPKKPKKKDG